MTQTSLSARHPMEATVLALNLAEAERQLLNHGQGQIDAIVDTDGKTRLMRPAQEQLLKRERHLQSILNSSADIITLVNIAGVILSQSLAVRSILGYAEDELIGSSIFRLIHPEDLAVVHGSFFEVIEGCVQYSNAQFRHRLRDGSFMQMNASMAKLQEADYPPSVVFSLRHFSNLSYIFH